LGLTLESVIVKFLLAVGGVIFGVPMLFWCAYRYRKTKRAVGQALHNRMKAAKGEGSGSESESESGSDSGSSSGSEWDVEHAIGDKLPVPAWMKERQEREAKEAKAKSQKILSKLEKREAHKDTIRVAAQAVRKASLAAATMPASGLPRRESLAAVASQDEAPTPVPETGDAAAGRLQRTATSPTPSSRGRPPARRTASR
jgi:hypothetical protein